MRDGFAAAHLNTPSEPPTVDEGRLLLVTKDSGEERVRQRLDVRVVEAHATRAFAFDNPVERRAMAVRDRSRTASRVVVRGRTRVWDS
jgi:hypothetical protein